MAVSTNVGQRPDIDSDYIVRDVEPALSLIRTKRPINEIIPIRTDPRAIQHTHEWFDQIISQNTTTLTANITAHLALATGITITLADSSIFTVGDQVTVGNLKPVYQVTAIPGGGVTLTVSEIRNVALASDAGNGDTAKFNRGQLERTAYSTFEGADLGTKVINYTQIFRKDVEISWHAQEMSQMNGLYTTSYDDLLATAVEQRLMDIEWELYEAITRGVKVNRASTSTIGMMGGVREFIDVSGGNVTTASGILTLSDLDDTSSLIYDDTSDLSNLVLVMPPGQNQTMASLETNRIRYVDPQPTYSVGVNTASYIPNLGGSNGIPIILDANMPQDEIWFLDRSRIYLIPFGSRSIALFRDQTPGTTARQSFIYGEMTLVVRNGAQAHGIIKGLTVA
jgi:hypothetical protein